MLSCKELALAVTSGEFAEASWLRRLEIRFHLFLCRPCRCYVKQVREVGKMARSMWCEPCPEDTATVERLGERICRQIDRSSSS